MSRKYVNMRSCGSVIPARGCRARNPGFRRAYSAVKSRHSRLVDSINAIFRSARHLLDLALAANSLVDIIEFFEVDKRVDVVASRE